MKDDQAFRDFVTGTYDPQVHMARALCSQIDLDKPLFNHRTVEVTGTIGTIQLKAGPNGVSKLELYFDWAPNNPIEEEVQLFETVSYSSGREGMLGSSDLAKFRLVQACARLADKCLTSSSRNFIAVNA